MNGGQVFTFHKNVKCEDLTPIFDPHFIMESLFFIQILFYLTGILGAFFLRRNNAAINYVTHVSAAAAGLAGVIYSLMILIGGRGLAFEFSALPFVGSLSFVIDSLAAFFIFVISFISIPASIFAVRYVEEFSDKKRISFLGFFYNLFLLAMILVVSVHNAFYFLIFWEMMSLTSYFLVVFEHEKQAARRAGIVYLVMTHIGTAFIAASFWLLFGHSGSFAFHDFQLNAGTLPPALKNAIFLTALIGFGTKAGIIPFHIWLPQAHPQAPSHVSALMSGVMIKTAIYALIRFIFTFMGDIPWWWGGIVLGLAIISTILGVLYALMEHDLKRLLAFHSIENIGIILLGFGMSIIFVSNGQPLYASFALIAALYHVLNHASFKGLLFLGAGAVLSKTHTRNMEELGGLIKKMPWTAACFLIGSVAISALPPLNGFLSEWMIFLAVLSGYQCPGLAIHFFAPVLAALLGFAGALAAACFVKAFGICFLGESRSDHAKKAAEVSQSMKLAMEILAASCLGFALLAPGIVFLLGKTAGTLIKAETNVSMFTPNGFLISLADVGQIPPFLMGGILIGGSLILFVFLKLTGNREIKIGPSWDCGLPKLEPKMQYTATGYSKPLRRIFSFLYQPTRRVELEDEGHEILRTAQRFESETVHIFEEWIYKPLSQFMLLASKKAKLIQTGHIQLYLSYIFFTLLLLLIYWSRL